MKNCTTVDKSILPKLGCAITNVFKSSKLHVIEDILYNSVFGQITLWKIEFPGCYAASLAMLLWYIRMLVWFC